VKQELKRRARVVRIFPSPASCLRRGWALLNEYTRIGFPDGAACGSSRSRRAARRSTRLATPPLPREAGL